MPDPRTDLERLPSENLFDIARNSAATYRKLAIELLVERASPLASRDEIAAEARQFVLSNPLIIKKIDPAASAFATRLPGVVDCIADGPAKNIELARIVDEHHAVHTDNHIALKSTVSENQAAGDKSLAEAYATLWRYFAIQVWQLSQDARTQKIDHDNQIEQLRAEHEKDNTAAMERLTLLERSPWRKTVDYVKHKWATRRRSPLEK